MKLKEEIKRKTEPETYSNSGQFSMHMKYSLILWDQLQIIMKICVPEREDKVV